MFKAFNLESCKSHKELMLSKWYYGRWKFISAIAYAEFILGKIVYNNVSQTYRRINGFIESMNQERRQIILV